MSRFKDVWPVVRTTIGCCSAKGGRPWLLPALAVALPILLFAQTPPAKEAKPQYGPAESQPTRPDQGNLGDAAAAAVEGAKAEFGEIRNPLEGLLKIMTEKQGVWMKAEQSALESIKTTGRQNPCSMRIANYVKAARVEFTTYIGANELYIQKWGELTTQAIGGLKNNGAEGDSSTKELLAERDRYSAQVTQLKDDMSKLPADDAAYDDARKENAELLQLLIKNVDAADQAAKESDKTNRARRAQVELLDARTKSIQAMKDNLTLRKQGTTNKYENIVAEWAAKCLAYTQNMGNQ